MGRLIVLDGLDGCGKSTQGERVARALREQGERVQLISFPDYAEPSSTLVKMYLAGEFSENPDDINAYAAGSFYAVDRYASYMLHWKKEYEAGATILATRYATSNAIHQMAKLPREEWDSYLSWLSDFEHEKLGLPRPDRILFLDMNRRAADSLLLKRYGGDASREDIHERDRAYLARCQESAAYAAKAGGWTVIRCDDGEHPLPQAEIAEKILRCLLEAM